MIAAVGRHSHCIGAALVMCPESRGGACAAWTAEKYYTKWSLHIHSGSTALNTHHVKFTTGDSEYIHNVVQPLSLVREHFRISAFSP